MVNVCQKGKRIERFVATWLREHGVASAKRTEQHNGALGEGDVCGKEELPNWHIECKGTKSARLESSKLNSWYDQIVRDQKTNKFAVLLNKADAHPLLAMIPFTTFKEHKVLNTMRLSANVLPTCLQAFNPIIDIMEMKRNQLALWNFFDSVNGAEEQRTISARIPLIISPMNEGIFVFMDAEDWVRAILPTARTYPASLCQQP